MVNQDAYRRRSKVGAVSFQLGRISTLEPFVKGQYACHKETNKDDSYSEIEKWIEKCRQVGLEAQLVSDQLEETSQGKFEDSNIISGCSGNA
jgi:hypothetical protein